MWPYVGSLESNPIRVNVVDIPIKKRRVNIVDTKTSVEVEP